MKKCRDCGATEDVVEFASHGNICKPCKAVYNKAYREKNKEKLKEWRIDYWEKQGREKRRVTVRKSNQRSPESFLRNLWHHIRKVSNYKRKHRKKAILVVEISYEYLLDLWESQNGRCALTGLPMDHVFNSLKTVSVDRIDSSKGYIPGNVQLVCKWVNLAKQDHSNADMLALIEELRK